MRDPGYSRQGSVGRAGQGSAGFTPGAGRGSGQGSRAAVCGRGSAAGHNCRDLNRRRLERDLGEYWGALSSKGITEAELHEKAKANSKIQPHVLGFIAARDKAELETQAEREPRDSRETAERQQRGSLTLTLAPHTPQAQYVLDLFDRYVVHNADFPPCADVSFLLRQTLSSGGKALLEGPL